MAEQTPSNVCPKNNNDSDTDSHVISWKEGAEPVSLKPAHNGHCWKIQERRLVTTHANGLREVDEYERCVRCGAKRKTRYKTNVQELYNDSKRPPII